MLEPQRLNELAGVVADGGTPDWESAEQSTSDADARQTIAQLRAVASVGRIFASLSAGSRTTQRRPVLSAGTSWGTLRVIEHVGRGRFGDVYRAWDPALDREVALKILCHVDGDDSADSHVIEEGRLMARVRHPNVVTIYGAQRIDGVTGLWMEFVEGRTLAAELAERGPFAEGELIRVGIELCHALAAVHEAGLLHRDVKAQNALRAERGRIMLGDFGTGRELDVSEDTPAALAGTPAYVAPELYNRQPATPRSDIYSLGTLLFHLATRKYPVPGRSLRELRDAHAECRRTPLRPLRRDLSARLTRAIEVSLDPEPARRFESAEAMERALEGCRGVSVLRRRWAIAALASVLAASALLVENIQRTNTREADAASNAARNETAPAALQAMKTSVFAPPGAKFVFHVPGSLAVSPDGKMLAFAALTEDGRMPLWIHPLEGGSARQLAHTESAIRPFWSPDGKWLGFFTREGLKKIHIDGGHPQTVCDRSSPPENVEDGAWSKNGVIFFSQGYGPIYQVPASGGHCTQVTALDRTKERGQHLWPSLLPDGRRFLYFWSTPDSVRRGIYAASLDVPGSRFVVPASQGAYYDHSGYLLFVDGNRLLAAPFDARATRITGTATVIVQRLAIGVRTHGNYAHVSLSNTGVLAYVEAGAPVMQLKWFDRTGHERGAIPVQEPLGFPAVSHDGRSVAVEVRDSNTGNSDIWVYDIERGIGHRITTHHGREHLPHWSPDDQNITFSSNRRGAGNDIYRIGVKGSGEEFLYGSEAGDDVTSWNGDGRNIVFNRGGREPNNQDLWLYSVPNRAAIPLFQPSHSVFSGRMSPDGRWVAYTARRSDGNEVWIRGVPPITDEVRLGKGSYPTWRGDGKELFYIEFATAQMMAVPIRPGPKLDAGAPMPLFRLPPSSIGYVSYDVSPDGQRFLINTLANPAALQNTAITIVQDWRKLLNK